MAIPACVDPNACGTDVSFNTSGIKVDIVPNNVGCGVDLSCSTSGLTASARLLANGGLECDGSRQLYVDRRGGSGASDPGGCYSPVNIDPAGGLWVPSDGFLGQYSGTDANSERDYPAAGASTAVFSIGSLASGACTERWIGHIQCQHNVTAIANGNVTALMEFVLSYTGIASSPIVTRNLVAFTAKTGPPSIQNANNYFWVPFVLNVPPLTNVGFQCQVNGIHADNAQLGAHSANKSVVMQGLRVSRFAA